MTPRERQYPEPLSDARERLLSRIVEQYYPLICRWLQETYKVPEDRAKLAAQDACIELWGELAKNGVLPDGPALMRFLRSRAVQRARTTQRSESALATHEEPVNPLVPIVPRRRSRASSVAETTWSSYLAIESPHDALLSEEARSRAGACLGRMSPERREAFICKVLQGMPTTEIACAMGTTERSVNKLAKLATIEIRAAVTGAETPPPNQGGES